MLFNAGENNFDGTPRNDILKTIISHRQENQNYVIFASESASRIYFKFRRKKPTKYFETNVTFVINSQQTEK